MLRVPHRSILNVLEKLCLECLKESIVCFQRFCPKPSLKMNFVRTNYKATATIHFKLNFSRTATSNYNFKLNFKPNFSRTTTSNYNFKPNFSRTTTSNYNFQLIFKLNFLSTSNWKLLQTKLFEHFELKVTSNYTFWALWLSACLEMWLAGLLLARLFPYIFWQRRTTFWAWLNGRLAGLTSSRKLPLQPADMS